MKRHLLIPGVERAIDPDIYSVDSLNPHPSTSVSWSSDGAVVSRYGDDVWDYSAWAGGRTEQINFRYHETQADDDVEIGKRLTLLTLFGMGRATSVRDPRYKYYVLTELARRCRARGFGLRDIPDRSDAFKNLLNDRDFAKRLKRLIPVATYAWVLRAEMGFTFMLPEQIEELKRASKDGDQPKVQTPYIPDSIYCTIIDTSISIIDRYLESKEPLEAFAKAMNMKYTEHRKRGLPEHIGPFHTGYYPQGSVQRLAGEHGLADTLSELSGHPTTTLVSFGAALNNVRKAGVIIISAMTFMRASEVLSLKNGSFHEDYHPHTGHIYYVRGVTTKTKKIRDTIWTTSAYTKRVFEALRHINAMCLEYLSDEPRRFELLKNFDDMLLLSTISPRLQTKRNVYARSEPAVRFYHKYRPSFLQSRCKLTPESLEEAMLLTNNLPLDKFVVGQDWPLAHHQFRRTGLVRAAASGMVSHPSLTYQAKHSDPKHTAYYQRNYFEAVAADMEDGSHLQSLYQQLDPSIDSEFENELLDALNLSNEDLKQNNERFFSPHGQNHKDNLLSDVKIISVGEFKKLKNGGAVRRTLLGACTEPGFCEYGTATAIKGCMSKNDSKPCAKAIVDTAKRQEIVEHISDIEQDLKNLSSTPENELIRESWQADINAGKAAVALIDQHLIANKDCP